MKTIKISIFFLLTIILSYYCFMSFQGLNILISKEGALILSSLGLIINIFLLPSVYIYFYKCIFMRNNNKRHTIYLIICSSLALLIMIINTLAWKNKGFFAPSILYPFDFLIIDTIILGFAIYSLIKLKNLEEKRKLGFNITLYILAFLGLDRLGASLIVILNYPLREILEQIPVILFNINFMLLLLFQILKVKRKKAILISVLYAILFASTTYLWLSLLADNSEAFMKSISIYYGIDRLAGLPIIIILLPIIQLLYLIYYTLNLYKADGE